MIKNIFFFCISFLSVLALCIVHTWLGWHTFEWTGDTSVMALMDMGGWHPVIISWMLKIAYFFTGYTIHTFLLLQIIPFYLALFIFIWAVYCRWRTIFALLFIVPFLTIQFYTMPLQLMSSSFSMVWILLLYALTFYMVLNPTFKSKWTKIPFYTFTGIVFIISLLSRHNAIVMVWPITVVWIGMYLNKKDFKIWSYLWRFGVYSFLSGIVCLGLLIGINKALTHSDLGRVYPGNSTFLAQITGSCVPELDESCFDENWWSVAWQKEGNKIERLKTFYESRPTTADALSASWRPDPPFLFHRKLDGLYEKWFYAITKYPNNYIDHLRRYYEVLWNTTWKRHDMLKTRFFHPDQFEEFSYYARPFSEREKIKRHEDAMKFNTRELRFYWGEKEGIVARYISDRLFVPKTIWAVYANFILFFVAFVLWVIRHKNNLILYFLSISAAGVLSNMFVPLFTPAVWARYTYPFFICATVAGCVLVILLCQPLAYLKRFIFKKCQTLFHKKPKKVKNEK